MGLHDRRHILAKDCVSAPLVFNRQQRTPDVLSNTTYAASQASTQAATPVQVPTHVRCGGFPHVGAHTLYNVPSIGRTCNALGPPLHPCSKCRRMQWLWQGCAEPTSAVPPAPQQPLVREAFPQAVPTPRASRQGDPCPYRLVRPTSVSHDTYIGWQGSRTRRR